MNNEINKLFKPNKEILSHDQAFKLKVSFLEKNKIQLSWDISKGCYLYKNIFSFKDIYQGKVETSGFPNGEMKKDEYFGEMEVFFSEVKTYIDLNNLKGNKIIVTYQGCSEKGYCYPPIHKEISIFSTRKEIKIKAF